VQAFDDRIPASTAPPDAGSRLHAMVDAQFDSIGRLLRGLGVPEADVDDRAQEVFIVAARRIDEVPLGGERGFLYRTAMNIAAHARRTIARRREMPLADLELLAHEPSAEDLVDRRKARAYLDALIDDMPVELRVVFVLFEVHELPTVEIAELLEIAPGTVASRLRRARAHFERRMQQWRARKGVRP
jgi:RNA polymerase sigma-70 factor (ECF subfamily)